MRQVEYLILGGGITGLAFANFKLGEDYLVLEWSADPGGYCRTIRRSGFTWDYSGHFFHFQDPEIRDMIFSALDPADLVAVEDKRTTIRYGGDYIDFPFQKNIHQLPKGEFIECLCDLFERSREPASTFGSMVAAAYGRAIAEKFLLPYNEKLYCTDLDTLDADAMGRFFPHASFEEIVANFRPGAKSASYNQSFTYHRDGAYAYIASLLSRLDPDRVLTGRRVVSVDPATRIARTTSGEEYRYGHLINTSPLDGFLARTLVAGSAPEYDASLLSANKVLVFNLGFDRASDRDDHWVYFHEPEYPFYRVGFYDNILSGDRMSLYVEIGLPRDASYDEADMLARVLAGLERAGVVRGHRLVDYATVVMDPAYVHVRPGLDAERARIFAGLAVAGIYSIGRYGEWKYCSIEDNIIDARTLSQKI